MKEVDANFICVDYETAEAVRSATDGMCGLTFIGVGDYPIDGAMHIKEMLADYGSCEGLYLCYALLNQYFE